MVTAATRRRMARCSSGSTAIAACQVKWHNWWNAPQTWAKVKAIDPVASHASWMENFPWTRLPGVDMPADAEADDGLARYQRLDPGAKKELLGDGNFGGLYQRADEDMLAIWEVAVDRRRAVASLRTDWALNADGCDARLHHPAPAAGLGRDAGHLGAGVHRRLRRRQPDRCADLPRRHAADPRAGDSRLRPRSAAVAAILRVSRRLAHGRFRPLLRLQHAGAGPDPVAPAGDAGAHAGRGDRRDAARHAARHVCRLPARRPRSRSRSWRFDPRLLGADLLDRARADLHLRGHARLAAGGRTRRDGAVSRRRMELPHAERLDATCCCRRSTSRCSSWP